MDSYTKRTRQWLEERFAFSKPQDYFAHQPIFGIYAGKCEPDVLPKLCRTFAVTKAISRFCFGTVLDVGAAEGYSSNIFSRLFEAKPVCMDLSLNALKAQKLFFGNSAVVCDAHSLPFKNDSFDAVFCSEALEHCSAPEKVLRELSRVSLDLVVLSVPKKASARRKGLPHAHLHSFSKEFFQCFFGQECFFSYSSCALAKPFLFLLNAQRLGPWLKARVPSAVIFLNNLFLPASIPLSRLFAPALLKLDFFLSNHFSPLAEDLVVVFSKARQKQRKPVGSVRLLKFLFNQKVE